MTFSPDEIAGALGLLFHWQVFAALSAGLAVGILVGALPGLTTATAMAILLPVSFFLDFIIALPFLIGLYKGGIFGGSIPAILIATPGTGASVPTTFDGPELVRRGQGRKAMDMALYASAFGDTVSDVLTLLLIVPISGLVLLAGPPELGVVLVLSILVCVRFGSGHWSGGALMACLGLFLGTIGQDPLEFTSRMTFGLPILENGIPIIPMLIGLFAIPEVLRLVQQHGVGESRDRRVHSVGAPLRFAEFKAMTGTLIRSSGLGALLGVIPGIGQPVAAHMGYALARRKSKQPQQFGKGALEGIAAAESANNAVNGPTLVPLLTIGIPGDKITAVLLGAFVAHGLRPGPQLMEEQGSVVLALLLAMLLGNALLLLVAKFLIPLMARIVTLQKSQLVPIILVLSLLGAYLYRSDSLDIYFLVVFGLLGIFAKHRRLDLAPLVLAFILTESLEYAVAQTLQLGSGKYVQFFLFDRPGAILLCAAAGLLVLVLKVKKRKKSI